MCGFSETRCIIAVFRDFWNRDFSGFFDFQPVFWRFFSLPKSYFSQKLLPKTAPLAPIAAEILFMAGFAMKRLQRIAGNGSLYLSKSQFLNSKFQKNRMWLRCAQYNHSMLYIIYVQKTNPTGFQNLSGLLYVAILKEFLILMKAFFVTV